MVKHNSIGLPVLPANADLEEAILGAIVVGGVTQFDRVSAVLGPQEFILESSRRIWTCMATMRERGDEIDRLSLSSELLSKGWIDSIGGLTKLSELDRALPENQHLETYCRKILDLSQRRQLMLAGHQLISKSQDETISLEELTLSVESIARSIRSGDDSEDGKTPEQIITDFPGGLSAFINPALRKKGVSTGLKYLDDLLGGGFQDGELIILAARPRVGKSAMASNLCQYISIESPNPQRTDFFSLEMSGESLITRILCCLARIDQHRFRGGFLNAEERHRLHVSLDRIVNSQLRIHDGFKKTLPSIARRIRTAFERGSSLVAIDYVQLLVTGSKSENRNLEIGEIGRTLKLLALELNKPILLLSQISRASDKRGGDQRPQLSDLKDSGTLEEHADTVAVIHREELIKPDREDLRGLADLDLLKQRNGPIGRIHLRFFKQFTKFENATDANDTF